MDVVSMKDGMNGLVFISSCVRSFPPASSLHMNQMPAPIIEASVVQNDSSTLNIRYGSGSKQKNALSQVPGFSSPPHSFAPSPPPPTSP